MSHFVVTCAPQGGEGLQTFLKNRGLRSFTTSLPGRDTIAVLNSKIEELEGLPAGDRQFNLHRITTPYILASREFKSQSTSVMINEKISVGKGNFTTIAGPCSIESESQILTAAEIVKKSGGNILRGGAFKPRSSPYSFQGTGKSGLKLLRKAGDATGLPVISELMDAEDLPLLNEYCDIIQIGARNSQNFPLLKKIGKYKVPVLLKRGLAMTIEEWLLAAEYILSGGNSQVILCERGIRTFENATRNTLDISAVPVLKQKTHLPVIVDPSHAAGDWKLVPPLSMAAVAAGADGIMIEMHPTPDSALCDGAQSLNPENFKSLMCSLSNLASFCRNTAGVI